MACIGGWLLYAFGIFLAEKSVATVAAVESECGLQQFKCTTYAMCIPLRWRCDGQMECPDGSDEVECHDTKEETTVKQLLAATNTMVRPVLRSADSVQVEVGFSVVSVREVSLKYQSVSLYGFLGVQWTDPRLRYSQAGLSPVRIPARLLWLPDLVTYNEAVPSKLLSGEQNALIYNTGKVVYTPPALITFTCQLSRVSFLTGTNNCHFEVGSWTYDVSKLNITIAPDVAVTTYFIPGLWNITNFTGQRQEKMFADTYPYVSFNVSLKRNAGFQGL